MIFFTLWIVGASIVVLAMDALMAHDLGDESWLTLTVKILKNSR